MGRRMAGRGLRHGGLAKGLDPGRGQGAVVAPELVDLGVEVRVATESIAGTASEA
jgi:hypothetical protein